MLLPPPRIPDTEPTLTTRPCPLASSNGRQARTVANGPRKLTATTKSKNASSRARRSACGITRVLPALLTRMSSRPSAAPIVSARASIARVSCAGVQLVRWPMPGRLPINRSAAPASLPKVTTTRAPASAKRRAVAAPRPLLPPVTNATRPSSMPMLRDARSVRCRRQRGIEGGHELDQIGLPQLGVEMAEMPVGVGSGRDQHITTVLDPLHRAFDGAELRRVRVILSVVDQHHFGLDLVEIGLGVVVHDRLDRPQRDVGIALRRLGQPALVERIGGGEGRRHFLNAGRAFGAEIPGGGVDVVARIGFVKTVVPVRVVPDRFGLGAAPEPVAAADLDRLTGERHDPVDQIGIHLGPHPGMHAAHRAADDQAQMGDIETLGNQPIAALDHVTVAVMGEVPAKPVGGLARPAAPERVLHDYEVLRRIERLARPEELVGEARTPPIDASPGVALQQQHAVDDLARRVPPCGAQRAVMELQLGQGLAAAEYVVPDDEVAFMVIRPFCVVCAHRISPCLRVLACSISRNRRSGVIGSSKISIPNGASASARALAMAAGAPIVPPSPIPRKPSTVDGASVSRWTVDIDGTSVAVGMT